MYNLVLLIQHEDNLTLEDAIVKAVEKHNTDMDAFLALAGDLLNADDSTELDLYISSLKHIIRGNADWSEKESTRYQFQMR